MDAWCVFEVLVAGRSTRTGAGVDIQGPIGRQMSFTTLNGVFHQICDRQIGVNRPAIEENESVVSGCGHA